MVLGMHRSGTSALTRVLSLLGCDLPRNILPAGRGNELGHWEAQSVMKVNERLLASAGSHAHDWQVVSPEWYLTPTAEALRQDVVAALHDDYGDSPFFVLKEPRLCRLFPFWKTELAGLGIEPVALLPIRNPLEVAESLLKRDGFELPWGYLMWLRNVLDAERSSRGIPRHFSTYEQLLANWAKLAEEAAETLGLNWPISIDKAAPRIEPFLSNDQRHHWADPAKVMDNPLMSSWLKDVYGVMLRWAETGEDQSDWALLDRVSAEMVAAEPAFGRAVNAGWAAVRWARELHQKQVDVRTEMENSLQAAARAEKSVAELTAGNAELRAALDVARAEVADQRAWLDSTLQERDALREEVAALRQACAAAEDSLSVRVSEAARLTDLVRRREGEKAEMAGLRDLAVQDAQAAEAKAAALGSEIAHLNELVRKQAEDAAEARSHSARLDVLATERNHRAIEAVIGWEGGSLIPGAAARAKEAILARMGLFDAEFYRSHYPDVAAAKIDPLRHFVRFGAREGRYWSQDIATLAQRKLAVATPPDSGAG